MTVGPTKKPVLVAGDHEAAAVDGELGALRLAGADQADDPVPRRRGDDRAHLAAAVAARSRP